MQAVLGLIVGALITLLKKLAVQELFEYALISLLEAGAKSTKNVWDDEFVAKVKEILAKS